MQAIESNLTKPQVESQFFVKHKKFLNKYFHETMAIEIRTYFDKFSEEKIEQFEIEMGKLKLKKPMRDKLTYVLRGIFGISRFERKEFGLGLRNILLTALLLVVIPFGFSVGIVASDYNEYREFMRHDANLTMAS